jgi:hypothetical protein
MVFRIFVFADSEKEPKVTNTLAEPNYGFFEVKQVKVKVTL